MSARAVTAPLAGALRWGICFALALVLPRRRRGGAAGALERRRRPGGERAGDHDRTRAGAGRARDHSRPNCRPARSRPRPSRAGAAAGKAGRERSNCTPTPQAEPLLTVTPPPKPVEKPKEKKPKQKHASLTSAPSTAEHKAERAAAPTPGAASRNSDALPNWKSQLVARLERYKRYPSEAQARGEHGVAQLAFSVDRSGGVHHARIVRSSGSSLLDRETLGAGRARAAVAAAAAGNSRRADRRSWFRSVTICADLTQILSISAQNSALKLNAR